jgi:hypothetical protein
LHGQFWVDGALEPEHRLTVKHALDRLSVPDTGLAYRFVRVSDAGVLWIREPLAAAATTWRWTIVDSMGNPTALIETPLRFEPHHISSDFVLGRWRDENGVNFIRLHRLVQSDDFVPPPQWIVTRSEPRPEISPEEEDRLLVALRSSLRQVVLAQESYWMNHMSYTDNRHLLTWTAPEGVRLDIIIADRTGWAAVATDQRLNRICGMAVGSGTPPGWSEGLAVCG